MSVTKVDLQHEQRKHNETREMLAQVIAQRDDLAKRLADAEAEVKAAQVQAAGDLKSAQTEVNNLRDQVSKLQSDLDNVQSVNRRAIMSADAARVKELEAELDRLQREIEVRE